MFGISLSFIHSRFKVPSDKVQWLFLPLLTYFLIWTVTAVIPRLTVTFFFPLHNNIQCKLPTFWIFFTCLVNYPCLIFLESYMVVITVYETDLQFCYYSSSLLHTYVRRIFSLFCRVLCIVIPYDGIYSLVSCLAYDLLLISNHQSLDSIFFGIF